MNKNIFTVVIALIKLKALLLSFILASSLLISFNSFSSWHGNCDPNDYLCKDDNIIKYGSATDFFSSTKCDPFIDAYCGNAIEQTKSKIEYRQDLSASDSYLSSCEKDAATEFVAGFFIASPLYSICASARDKKASMTAGDTAYNNGDYKKAFDIFKPFAELAQGDAIAQQRIGQMYYEGKGVPQDYNQAVFWYSKSYKHGYVTDKEYNKILSKGRVKGFTPDNY